MDRRPISSLRNKAFHYLVSQCMLLTAKKASKNTRHPEHRKSTFSFEPTKEVVSRESEMEVQNCTKIPPLFQRKIVTTRAEKAQKHYVLNGFAEMLVSRVFKREPNGPSRDLIQTAGTLFYRTPNRPRNPLKTSAKPLRGESGDR